MNVNQALKMIFLVTVISYSSFTMNLPASKAVFILQQASTKSKGDDDQNQSRNRSENLLHNTRSIAYGALLEWQEVDDLIPRKSVFKVSDLDTGLSFYVQRRAGRNHADVQPLTREDTEIMKEIYNGKWSWGRRAIVIESTNQRIAASMHGMPHGRGALKNGFPGHFCIHFKGTTTHKTKRVDPTHQVMVYKAAGQIDTYLSQIESAEMIDIFIMAVNQQDQALLRILLSTADIFHLENNDQILYLTKHSIAPKEEETFLHAEHLCHLNILTKEGTVRKQANFSFSRNAIYEPWKITNITMDN